MQLCLWKEPFALLWASIYGLQCCTSETEIILHIDYISIFLSINWSDKRKLQKDSQIGIPFT